METAADEPFDSAHPASEPHCTLNATSTHANSVKIVYNRLDEPASYKKLIEELFTFSASNNLTQEEKARIGPRLRSEAGALFSHPSASCSETIDGILMQRFFGSSRSSIHRCYRRGTDAWSSTQPVDNAVSRFIGTPELLEMMLSHLPVRNLISSTRVSKTFRHLVHNSPTLQRNLFLRPQKELSETQSVASHDEAGSENHSEQAKEYKLVNLCPLLHIEWQSHLTAEERFWSEDHEIVAINECATDADSFTQMYLTNPPCVEVDIKFVYQGTEIEENPWLFEDPKPDTHHYLIANRKICKETGVTFAMLMEAIHTQGSVCITEEVQFNGEYNDGIPEEEDGPWTEIWRRVVEDTTVHNEIRTWEEKHPKCGMMLLDGGCTAVRLHGVVVRTAADFAAIEKADRDLKMEERQRKIFQAVLLELMHRAAVRADTIETIETAEEYGDR